MSIGIKKDRPYSLPILICLMISDAFEDGCDEIAYA